jgi:hypothetical protein
MDGLATIEHIRKCRLGWDIKWNAKNLFDIIFNNPQKWKLVNNSSQSVDVYPNKQLRQFKKLSSIILKPKVYVSKSGRQFKYFTDKDLYSIKDYLMFNKKGIEIFNSTLSVIENGKQIR